ncbi:MAG: flavin reductase family protein [Deltaproteobacteria bacterium]|nr:flavin reductase family protein [Deltaproteobacteria bacterium]
MQKRKIGPSTMLFPMPSVLVGAKTSGRANFMTVAWCGIASHQPPAICVAVRKKRFTLDGIESNAKFSVNIPGADLMKKVDFCGIYSGRDKDKSGLFTVFIGDLEDVPLIEECPVNLECVLKHQLDLGSHWLVIGEIVQTHISEDCYTEDKADPLKINPLIYSPSSQNYHRLGEIVGKAFYDGRDFE